jgi:hypothetical protein
LRQGWGRGGGGAMEGRWEGGGRVSRVRIIYIKLRRAV